MSKRPTKKYKNQIKTNKTKQADKQTNKETKHKLKLRLIKKQGVNLGTHEGPAVPGFFIGHQQNHSHI